MLPPSAASPTSSPAVWSRSNGAAARAPQRTVDSIAPSDPVIAAILAKVRPYQMTALRISKERFMQGVRRQLIVCPTGTGKTVLFSTVAHYFGFGKRILVLVHRDTLAKQAQDKISKWNPGVEVGIEQGNQRCKGTERVVVASVQTIGRPVKQKIGGKHPKTLLLPNDRLKRLNPDDFDCIITDECHHGIASSYRLIYQHFGFLDETWKKTEPCPNRLLLGVTATPKRSDGELLNQVFDRKVYEYAIEDAVREGWLTNLRCFRITTESSLDDVHRLGDDLKIDELAKAVNNKARNKLIVDEWLDRAKDRPTIVFAVDVQHAKDLAKEFKKRKIKAAAVWGSDPEREEKLKQFDEGKLLVLVNCELLTEGYDSPRISCVILARPTESEALFKQMVGRGTRLQEGISNMLDAMAKGMKLQKVDCIVLDIADLSSRHSLVVSFAEAYGLPEQVKLEGQGLLEIRDAVASLEKKKKKDADGSQPGQLTPPLFTSEEINQEIAALAARAEEVDLLKVKFEPEVVAHSHLQWHKLSQDSYVLLLPSKERVYLYRNESGFNVLDGRELPPPKRFFVEGKIKDRDVQLGFMYADRKLYEVLGEKVIRLVDRKCETGWRAEPASEPQKRALLPTYRAMGKEIPPDLTKGQANLLITKQQLLQRMHSGNPILPLAFDSC